MAIFSHEKSIVINKSTAGSVIKALKTESKVSLKHVPDTRKATKEEIIRFMKK